MRSVGIIVLAMLVMGCAVEATENPHAAQTTGQDKLAGKVLEVLDVPGYTYVRFETAEGEAWAAVPQTRLEIGAQIVIVNPQAMVGFESKTLGRKFDTIYFGTLENQRAASPAKVASSPAVHSSSPAKVMKTGDAAARSIAALYAERGALDGKLVELRGKVVKYSAGIMGRNWIHLQDGTGDASDGTNDITVTSSGTTSVGQTIVVQGTVAVDKDFGAGYRYSVIVEDASVE